MDRHPLLKHRLRNTLLELGGALRPSGLTDAAARLHLNLPPEYRVVPPRHPFLTGIWR